MTLTDELTAAIVENIGLGMHRRSAAAAAGVSTTMLASWEKRAATTKGKAHRLVAAIVAAEARVLREAYADRSGLSPLEFAEQNVRDVTRLRARAEGAGSSQACAMLNRQLVKAFDALAVARKAGDVGLNEMSEEEFLVVIDSLCEDMAEPHFQAIFRNYEGRHRGRLMFVAEGGTAVGS